MAATKGEYKAPQKKGRGSERPLLVYLLFLLVGISFILNYVERRKHYHSGGSRGWTSGGGFFGGGFLGGDSEGGFSGGGGGFGGGGASGSW
jgi:uncharacterized protein